MPWGQPVTPPPAPPKGGETRVWVIVVQIQSGCDLSEIETGEVIVTAVHEGHPAQKVQWRTRERPELGSRWSVQIGPVVREVA